MDIQDLLHVIENELNQEFEVNDQSQNRARQAVERSLTLSTPVRRFYEWYRDGNDKKRQELFDDWLLRFLNSANNDLGAKRIRLPFMQYLRLGANYRSAAGFISNSGGVRKIQYLLGKGDETNMPENLWVMVYVNKIQPISNKYREFIEIDDKAA